MKFSLANSSRSIHRVNLRHPSGGLRTSAFWGAPEASRTKAGAPGRIVVAIVVRGLEGDFFLEICEADMGQRVLGRIFSSRNAVRRSEISVQLINRVTTLPDGRFGLSTRSCFSDRTRWHPIPQPRAEFGSNPNAQFEPAPMDLARLGTDLGPYRQIAAVCT